MALKKPTPAFENESTGSADNAAAATTTAAPADTATTNHAEEKAAAQAEARTEATVETNTAIARASGSSALATNELAAKAKNFKKEVEAMYGAADFSFGSHRVFKAKDGVIKEMNGDKLVLGKWVKARLLAWDRHFEISPGEDGKSSAEFVAYSKDGVTIDNVVGEEQKSWEGKPVAEYIDHLHKVEEFDKAGKREFIDCQVAALGAEEEPEFFGVIQITLSSSSIPAFRKFQTDLEATARCVEMGLPGYKLPEDPFTMYFIREAAEKGKNSWTKLKLASTLPAKV